MNPIQKLREDVQYWRDEVEKAWATLDIGEAILPKLEEQLGRLGGQLAPPVAPLEVSVSVPRISTIESDRDEEPRFSGDATQQVEQALKWKSPQSSADLLENFSKYGREYSTGAIGFALRKLQRVGKVREATKVGNLRFYEPVSPASEGDETGGNPEYGRRTARFD